jgi:HAMP domain-containing protein
LDEAKRLEANYLSEIEELKHKIESKDTNLKLREEALRDEIRRLSDEMSEHKERSRLLS